MKKTIVKIVFYCIKIGLSPPDEQSGKKNKKGLASVILAPIRLKVNW